MAIIVKKDDMIKYLALCLILLAGCVVDTEPVDEYDEVVVAADKPAKPDWSAPGPPNDLGCMGDVYELPDGSVMEVPGLCAPFYIYRGYPDPTQNPYEEPYGEQNSQPSY